MYAEMRKKRFTSADLWWRTLDIAQSKVWTPNGLADRFHNLINSIFKSTQIVQKFQLYDMTRLAWNLDQFFCTR